MPKQLKIKKKDLGKEGATEECPQNLQMHFPEVLSWLQNCAK